MQHVGVTEERMGGERDRERERGIKRVGEKDATCGRD